MYIIKEFQVRVMLKSDATFKTQVVHFQETCRTLSFIAVNNFRFARHPIFLKSDNNIK